MELAWCDGTSAVFSHFKMFWALSAAGETLISHKNSTQPYFNSRSCHFKFLQAAAERAASLNNKYKKVTNFSF